MLTLRKTLKPSSIFTSFHRLIATVKLPEPATSAAYDDLTTTAGDARDFATVRHLLNHRNLKGCFTTNNTFKFISKDLSILNDVLKTISDLNEKHARKKAYESLIAQLCKLQRVDDALRVAEEASDDADFTTFHPILSFLTRKKDFDHAWHVVELMKAKNIARDVTCYNFFLTSYSIARDLGSNVDVLKKMDEEKLKPDARTYDALVLGACKIEKMDGAMAILGKMLEDGVEAMYSTYAHVIVTLVRLGYCAQAVEFVVSYEGKDKKLDSHNFGLLAIRLISMEKVDEAKYVLEEMVKRDIDLGERLEIYYNENVKVSN